VGQKNHRYLQRIRGNSRAGSAGGTYLFKLADSPSNRHIVQIWNADQNEILATIMTVRKRALKRPTTPCLNLTSGRALGSGLKVWFYPGDTTGENLCIRTIPLQELFQPPVGEVPE